MTRTAQCAFPWKTRREKVPYEGRTRGSDRAAKTRTAILEKSMRVNDKEKQQQQFCCYQILFFPKWVMKVNILRANFTIQVNLGPMQNYFSRQLTPKVKKEI